LADVPRTYALIERDGPVRHAVHDRDVTGTSGRQRRVILRSDKRVELSSRSLGVRDTAYRTCVAHIGRAVHITVTPFAARGENGAGRETDPVALAEPDVAVIVAVPPAIEVTRPEDETVPTSEPDVAHVTLAPEIVLPFASATPVRFRG